MRPKQPRPGTTLGTDHYSLIVVVQRGWSDEQIRRAIAAANVYLGLEVDATTCSYTLHAWRYHTAEQRRAEWCEYDEYWSPEGAGKTIVDVAVVP